MRRSKCVEIGNIQYVFTRRELQRGRERAARSRAIQSARRRDIEDKVKICPKLARQRSLRLKLEADAAAEARKQYQD